MDTKKRLRVFMKHQAYTQQAIADKIKINRTNFSNYLNGSVAIPYTVALSLKAECGLNPEWLLHGKIPMFLEGGYPYLDSMARNLLKNYMELENERYKKYLLLNSQFLVEKESELNQADKTSMTNEHKSTKMKSNRASLIVEGAYSEEKVPYLGKIAAGVPIDVPDHWNSTMLLVPGEYFTKKSSKNHYVLQVEGDSMIDEDICNQDYILVEHRRIAHHNEIVVAFVDNETTLKRIQYEKGKIILMPGNPKMKPLTIKQPESLEINGIFVRNLGKNVKKIN